MDERFSNTWGGTYPLTPSLLSELVERWDLLTQGNKLGVFFSVLGIKLPERMLFRDIFPEFLRCLERDMDNEVQMFHPLAKNFVDGLPLAQNLPEDCQIRQAAKYIKEQLQGVNFSFRAKEYIYFAPSTRGKSEDDLLPLPPKQKHFELVPEPVAWEDCWAAPDPPPKVKQATSSQINRVNKFLSYGHKRLDESSAGPSTDRRAGLGPGRNPKGMIRPGARPVASRVDRRASSQATNDVCTGSKSYAGFKKAEIKVKTMSREEAVAMLRNETIERQQALLKQKEQAKADRLKNRELEKEAIRKCKAADKEASKRFPSSTPTRVDPTYAPANSAQSLACTPVPDSRHHSSRPSSAYVSESDEGHSPKPFLDQNSETSSPANLASAKEQNEDDLLSPELIAALNFSTEVGESQGNLPDVKPKAPKVARIKSPSPVQLPDKVEEKLDVLLNFLSSSPCLHPDDLTSIRHYLDGNYTKPKHVHGNLHPIVLSVEYAPRAKEDDEKIIDDGNSYCLRCIYFEAKFLPSGRGTWDVIIANLDDTSDLAPATLQDKGDVSEGTGLNQGA